MFGMSNVKSSKTPVTDPGTESSGTQVSAYSVASSSLIFAMASAGLSPFGHVREQLKMVWQRYMLKSF